MLSFTPLDCRALPCFIRQIWVRQAEENISGGQVSTCSGVEHV